MSSPDSRQSQQPKKEETAVEIRRRETKAIFLKNYSLTANISVACQQTNINRWTYYDWMKKDQAFADEVKAVREGLIDLAESKLMGLIKEGNVVATIFFLKCQGKGRGYVERQEVTGADGRNLMDGVVDPRKIADGLRDALADPEFRRKVVEIRESIDARTIALMDAGKPPQDEDAVTKH